VATWNSHMQDNVIWYPSYAEKLCKVLKEFFNGCLETFKQYCLTVASADFLTGKAKNSSFKAFLWWALKPDKIQMILEGAYGVKSFFTIKSTEQQTVDADIKRLETDKKAVEYNITKHLEEIEEGQAKLVAEHKLTLPTDELDAFREESDREYYEKYPEHQGIKDKYSERLLDIHFNARDGFLTHKVREKLGLSETIIPQELLDEKQRLSCALRVKYHQRDEFTEKNKGWRNHFLYVAHSK